MSAATMIRNDAELAHKAIARVCEPVDNARAVFQGRAVVGHRDSFAQGSMHWALPGGRVAWGPELAIEDRDFRVVQGPTNQYLAEQAPVLRTLFADAKL